MILNYNSADFKIHGRETEKVLTVAFVGLNETVRMVNLLVNVLWEFHYTNVLFVFKAASETQNAYGLFQLCWQHGFVNVLALINQTMYTYHPFRYIKVVRLHTLSEYYNKSHLHNFQGYPLRGIISNNSPRVYRYKDNNGNIVNGGYLHALIIAFIKHHNGTFQEVVMPTYAINLTDLIEAFRNRQLDILADMLYMYSDYSHSNVICNYRTYLMVPYAKPIPRYLYIFKPMDYWMWLLLLFIIFYATAVQMFLSWLHVNILHFGVALLRTLSSVLYVPSFYYRNCTRAQIFCSAILLLSGFLLTNLYQTFLASFIISHLYEPQINSIADIAHTNYRIPQTQMDATYLRSLSGVPQIVYDRLLNATADEVYKWRREMNTSFIHSTVEDKLEFFMYQQKFLRIPLFKLIDEAVMQLPLFITIAHGSPFVQQLNSFLRKIFDTGIFEKMFSDSAEEGILSGEIEFYRVDSKEFEPIDVAHFSLIFAAWAVGLLGALICFLIELKGFKK
ncbi:uncharacterized protein LOC129242098 [Anastrepha obliqua]|uniref:uncharacterized protein LOC129242098 n=1 Tax=Anastrepha obliqua TaxID=95512 RepID=UPI00240A42DF|nr:uncharacterized protein LOC129242098 [Anastrepha obliqua]